MVGRDPGGARYSPLTQITAANVTTLQVAWTYHMRPAVAPASSASDTTGTAPRQASLKLSEDQPLVVGDTMYVVTPYSRVVALDSATGKEKWVFEIPNGDNASLRGAAYWPGDASSPAALLFGTRRGSLYSISAKDGQSNTAFGDRGVVSLKTPEVMTTGMQPIYILPSPPVVYKDLVITGAGPGEGPGGLGGGLGPAGDTRAWDVRTGKLVWTFHSVPRPGEVGHETWSGDTWKNRSGVNVWGLMTLDAPRGILYMPFGAPNNDRVGVDRPGNNLFSSSLVAVEASTGKLLWYFQVVHHDIWDLDTQAPPTLFDVHRGGKTIPAVATVNKNGLMFLLDRVTGKPLYDMLLGEVPYTPPQLDRYTVALPGTQGGVNFYGGAFDARDGLFIVNVNNLGQPMRIMRNADGSFSNSGPLAGSVRFWDPETHLPCTPTPWGQLVAVNVDTGAIAWRSTLGVTDRFPEGKQKTGRPGLGGAIVTASGLVFIGSTDDARFRAFRAATGEEIWTATLPASAESTPITYADGKGRQYVAIVATGGGLIGAKLLSDEVVVYALPK